jgi:hypothetical protein
MNRSGALEVDAVQGGVLGQPIWSSGSRATTPGGGGGMLQDDGNLVVYEGPKALWDSKSFGKLGHYHLAVGDDGAVAISNEKGAVVWSSAHQPAAKS